MVAVVLAVRITSWHARAARVLSRFAAAVVLGGAAAIPVYLPYYRVARDMHMVRSLEAVSSFSATPMGYLAAAGRIHFSTWSGGFFRDPVDAFFPGVVVIVLAVAAAYWTFRRANAGDTTTGDSADAIRLRRQRVVMLIAIAVTGFVLSLGTKTPVYGWLYHVFPPMQGLRAAARFGNLFLLGMAALAGFGLAALRPRLPAPRAAVIVSILVVLANVESLRAPLFYSRFDGIPAIYSLLAHEPGRVVLVEVPFYPAQAFFENGPYVLNSTAHWRPLMNGYSGYVPQSYREYAAAFWYFPRDYAIEAMRKAGATHVMIHPDKFGPEAEEMWRIVEASPYLERIAISPNAVLYRLR
jgi:hypothetical protein